VDVYRRHAAPDGAHRASSQARRLADPPVGSLRLRADDRRRGGFAVRERQRQAVRDIGPHGSHECLAIVTVEEPDFDHGLAEHPCRAKAMHPVDDAHRLPVHKDGRPAIPHFRQSLDVLKVLAAEPGRIRGPERGSGNHRRRQAIGYLAGGKTRQVLRHADLSA